PRSPYLVASWHVNSHLIIPKVRKIFTHFEIGEEMPAFLVIDRRFGKPLRKGKKMGSPTSTRKNIRNPGREIDPDLGTSTRRHRFGEVQGHIFDVVFGMTDGYFYTILQVFQHLIPPRFHFISPIKFVVVGSEILQTEKAALVFVGIVPQVHLDFIKRLRGIIVIGHYEMPSQ